MKNTQLPEWCKQPESCGKSLTGRCICPKPIFFKEFPEEPEFFNLDNKATFTVEELKEFSETFAERVIKRGDKSDLTGFWSLCKEMYYNKFK